MSTVKKEFTFNNNSLAEVTGYIEERLISSGIEKRNVTHLCLSLEEMLLRWRDNFGEDIKAELTFTKHLGSVSLSLRLKGEMCDPLESSDELLDFNARLLADLGLAPTYSYSKGVNRLSLRIRTNKPNQLIGIVAAVVLAAVVGTLGVLLFPNTAELAGDILLGPLRDSLLGLLTAVAVPTIFISVFIGICGAGDLSTLSRIGSGMIKRYVGFSIGCVVLLSVLLAPLFSLVYSGNTINSGDVSSMIGILLAIIPDSLFEPFVTGDTLQTILISVIAGFAVIAVGERSKCLVTAAESLNAILYCLLEWVTRLVPMIIFVIVTEMIWSGKYLRLLSVWKPLVITLAAFLVIVMMRILFAAMRMRISPLRLARKIMPAFIIAITTASSSAAYGTNMDCCVNRLGIDQKTASLGIPVGINLCVPVCSTYYMICAFYGAEQYGIECSIVWFLVAWISSFILSVATPPIPGGSIACYTMLFAQLGIPTEAIAFAATMDILSDCLITSGDMVVMQMEMLAISDDVGKLDRAKLHA